MAASEAGDRLLRERLIEAEQDERRRIAVVLHDGPVQSLAGIALMLDADTEKLRLQSQPPAASRDGALPA